jgi:hypothetical protein
MSAFISSATDMIETRTFCSPCSTSCTKMSAPDGTVSGKLIWSSSNRE